MPRRTEIPDYEPVTRKRSSNISESQATDDLMSVRMRPDTSLQNVAAVDGQPLWASKERAGKVSIPEVTAGKQEESKPQFKENWIIKRGHALSYAGLFVFTIVLYFRPYELFSALSSLTSLAFWVAVPTLLVFSLSQLSLEGNLTARPREVNLALLLVLAALISMPLALNPAEAWETFNKEFIKAILMFIVIVNVVRTERRLKGMLLLALAVSCLVSINALNDYRSGRFAFEGYRITGSIGGMLGNPNDMALHLVTILPIAVALVLTTRNYFAKVVYGFCLVLMVIAIVVTYSRGGFIGLVCVAGVLAWKFGRRHRLAVLLLAIVSIGLFISFVPGNYMTRIASIFDSTLDPNGSSTARSELFKRSVVIAIANPLFGIGMGNFHIVSIREAVTHNSFTQVAAEMGMLASVIYTMFIVAPLNRLRRIERETSSKGRTSRFYYLAIGLQVSLVGYLVGSFFASVAYLFYVYYLVGYAVCLRRIYEAELRTLEKMNGTVGTLPATVRGGVS
jgi:putative inorganic carbon (hco3(-)) transporter